MLLLFNSRQSQATQHTVGVCKKTIPAVYPLCGCEDLLSDRCCSSLLPACLLCNALAIPPTHPIHAHSTVTKASECLPLPVGTVFSTTVNPAHTHWLYLDAGLGEKHYKFGVYAASVNSEPHMYTASTPPTYGKHGSEYDHEPSSYPLHAVRGKATHYTALLSSVEHVLKGGSIQFTAGFVDDKGNIKCPTGIDEVYAAPKVASGLVPMVKCGE